MTRVQNGIAAAALTGVMALSSIVAPIAANASQEGRRNTAIGIGAAVIAGVLLSQHDHHSDRDRDRRYHEDYRDQTYRDYRDQRDSGYRDQRYRDYRDQGNSDYRNYDNGRDYREHGRR